jgi:hypothetical protein
MPKWADFLVMRVRYNSEGTHIDAVQMCEDLGDKCGELKVYNRSVVANAIKDGTTVLTVTGIGTESLKKGKPVRRILVNGVYYLRTDANEKEADNLENLPEF